MVTRFQKGEQQSQIRKYAHISMYSPMSEPKCLKDACNSPLWLETMHEELKIVRT